VAQLKQLKTRIHIGIIHVIRETGQRIREQGRPTLSWVLRLTVSAVASYAVADTVLPHDQPLLAPLTALLVTQVTLYSMARQGVDRVMAVIAGVSLATIFASIFGLTWASLALLIFSALMVGQFLRLGDNLIEVPITAMFVLAVGEVNAAPAALDRVASTIIGATVGLGINILIPPGVRTSNAGLEVERYADEIAVQLEAAAAVLPEGSVTTEQSAAWLTATRGLTAQTVRIDKTITYVEESRKLNVRALNKPNTTLAMRYGLDALEHCTVAIRSIFRGIDDVVNYPDDVDDIYPQQAREMTANAMQDLAYAIRTFGDLVHAQVRGDSRLQEEAMIIALEYLQTERSNASAYMRASMDSPAVYELNVFVVATMGRVLRELDLRGHSWIRNSRVPYADERARAAYAARKLQLLTRQMTLRRPHRPGKGSNETSQQDQSW